MLQKIQMVLLHVMGHEIAHAVAKHSVERASRGYTSTNYRYILLIDILTGGKLGLDQSSNWHEYC